MPDSNLTELQRAMNNLSGPSLATFKRKITYFVAMAVKGVIAAYPGPAHSPVIWPSDNARKAYFAQRRERGLPMKYKRGNDPMSQRIQQSWTVHSRTDSATLGNRATYAPYVVSDQYQTEQHKATGFKTDKQAVEKAVNDGTVERIITTQIRAMMDDAFRGLK